MVDKPADGWLSGGSILFWGGYRVFYDGWLRVYNGIPGALLTQTSYIGAVSTITVEASSTTGHIKVYADDILRLDYAGPTGLSGYVGLYGKTFWDLAWDRFRVYRLP